MNSQQVHISTINGATINATMISDTISDATSEEDADFDDSDILNATVNDEVTAQLVSAGPIGVAAAAAIATAKKRKRPHVFETNPSVRKRQQTRLLRKLRATIDEYTTRVGQQAIVLCCTPGKIQHNNSFRVFGSQPLESIIRGRRADIMGDLDGALAQQAPPQQQDNPTLHELPPLNIDGIPTPLDKMTQAQLRAFIPEMLKYSTGRSKPGWGKPEYRPVWWPDDVAWANVRSDVRTGKNKRKSSAFCFQLRNLSLAFHHVPANKHTYLQDDTQVPQVAAVSVHSVHFPHQPIVQTINNPDGTVSVIQIDTGDAATPHVITLADGTQAQVVQTIPNGLHNGQEQNVHTLAEVATNQHDINALNAVEVNHGHAMATLAEATINSEGQIILTADPNSLAAAGVVTIPVSMYQSVVTSLSQLNDNAHLTSQTIANHLSANSAGIQVIAPESIDDSGDPGGDPDDDVVNQSMEDEDIKPLVTHTLMETSSSETPGDVPDATQAVEVMSADAS
ncbi:hypothetical protein LSH36_580g00029 [Paralvinella palmiformis]|uniref:Nuclear respiratory factor 1 NLS/DNA-binding dimerisation domain-containing protein n=1 Tax=Paralvinella palmiformis TaxID=53620 RepID=A0AAD9J743_9ANNE|nr:hypothetical protein LSH36_580g00029 [Paralvinella palmiformis]